jgi:hypothetical protein
MTGQTVPKSMRRIKEEWQGLPIKYVAVIAGFAITCLILIIVMFASRNKIPSLLLLFLVIAFFTKFMRTPAILTRSWLSYQFLIRGFRGQNVIPKYAVSAGFMKSIIPIMEFHQGGIIEFSGKKYEMLLKADPARVSDDELEQHINQVRSLTDSLHGELLLKSYVVSLQTAGRPIERALMNQLNEPGRTKQEQEHLYSLYKEASDNTAPVIQWKFYIFLGFGKYSTLQEAEIAKGQYYPGITDRLNKAGMHIIPIQDRQELGATYRQLISQVQT